MAATTTSFWWSAGFVVKSSSVVTKIAEESFCLILVELVQRTMSYTKISLVWEEIFSAFILPRSISSSKVATAVESHGDGHSAGSGLQSVSDKG
jgi:hypothetical protein